MERIWENIVASSSRAEPRKINDSVFEVFAPKDRRPSVEIVFFHGLQLEGYGRAQFTTWLSRDQSELWLYWILEKVPNARILTVLYDGHPMKTYEEGLMDMYQTRENLVINLTHAEVGQDGCPVVLVGHGIGGLVMKELCMQASSILDIGPSDESDIPVKNFLNQVKALFFFATPHLGTRLADESVGVSKGPLFEDAKTNKKEAARRNEDFRKLRQKYGWKTFGIAEGRESHLVSPYLGTFSGFIVGDASARSDVDTLYTDTSADHFEVCRPHSRQSSSFQQLSKFVTQVLEQDNKARDGHKLGCPDEVIGLQDQVNLVLKELQKAPRLGIVGMGGIGKTTLAKAVYNAISHKFEYSCFLPEVKKLLADEENPDNLRATIVKDLYWNGRKVPKDFKWSTLKGKSVFVVLDDAKTECQVRVMTNLDGFLEDSRVIVTSRDRAFLIAENFKCQFAVPLDDRNSKELFCLHAFGTMNSPIGFEEHLGRILEKCAGLPLALKVAGRYLCGRPQGRLWDAALEKLSRAQPLTGAVEDGLWSILTVSYNSLAPAERELFLDVATVFHGERVNEAKTIWEMCGWQGVESSWENLLDKGLVAQVLPGPYSAKTYGSWMKDPQDFYPGDDVGDYIIDMHEVLRDLGRSKACPDPRYVLDHSRVSYNVVNPASRWLSNQGQPKVEVLKISNFPGDDNSKILNMNTVHGLNALRILWLEGGNLKGGVDVLPRGLTCLKVSKMREWIDSRLSLFSSKSEQHPTLQYFEIEWCLNLQRLPSFLEHLQDLKHLSISTCVSLRVLPSLRRLQALEQLTIEGCPSLKVLPECLGKLHALKYLWITQCDSLNRLPNSFGELGALQHLEIKNCYRLVIPHTVTQLESLEHLEIKDCHALGILGDVIGQLKELRHLELDSGHYWDAPLSNLGRLQALEYLRISEKNGYYEALPDGLGELSSLKHLGFTQGTLSNGETLGQLQALETLIIESGKLETLTKSLGQLQALQHLHIQCPLKALPDTIGNLQALEYLRVGGDDRYMSEMESLPDALGELKGLKRLKLACLPHLKYLPQSFCRLTTLRHLILYECPPSCVASIPRQLQALEELDIAQCRDLEALPDVIAQLPALKRLTLASCPRLRTLPDSLGHSKSLEHLYIDYCKNLEDLPDSLKQREFTVVRGAYRQSFTTMLRPYPSRRMSFGLKLRQRIFKIYKKVVGGNGGEEDFSSSDDEGDGDTSAFLSPKVHTIAGDPSTFTGGSGARERQEEIQETRVDHIILEEL